MRVITGGLAVLVACGCAHGPRASLIKQVNETALTEAAWRERIKKLEGSTVRVGWADVVVVVREREGTPPQFVVAGRDTVEKYATVRLVSADGTARVACDEDVVGVCDSVLVNLGGGFEQLKAEANAAREDIATHTPPPTPEPDANADFFNRGFHPSAAFTAGAGLDIGTAGDQLAGGLSARAGVRLYRGPLWGVAIVGQVGFLNLREFGLATAVAIPVRLELHYFADHIRHYVPNAAAWVYVAPVGLFQTTAAGGGIRAGIGGQVIVPGVLPLFLEVGGEVSWFAFVPQSGLRVSFGIGF